MELGSIMEFLNNKSILVIGATGFLAKNIVPSQKKFISSRLTNYDFVPLIFVVMCCDKINLLTSCFLTVAVFVEKILRVQPKVKKLYLLLRAVDTKSVEERFIMR